MKVEEIISSLAGQQYLANKEIGYALLGAIDLGTPLLGEGAPGVGKSSLAVATAKALDVPLIRLQCYEGITPESVLYDYDYQRQLMVVSAMRDKLNQAMTDMDVMDSVKFITKNVQFYGEEFLLPRPVLRALRDKGRKVLLIDEIDKTSEEIEHTLLEVLSDFAISIPEYGTVRCDDENRPIVILTSNRYRNLSEPMKRRCAYLYLKQKTYDEILNILELHVSASHEFLARMAGYIEQVSKLDLQEPASVSEGIAWVEFVLKMFGEIQNSEIHETLPYTAGYLAKNEADKQRILYFGETASYGPLVELNKSVPLNKM